MKKILSILMILTMVFSLVACTSSSSSSTPDAKNPTPSAAEPDSSKTSDQPKTWDIVVIPKNAASQWGVRQGMGVEKFAKETGHNAFYKGPAKVDAASQVQVLEDMIAQGVDAICIVPLDISSVEPALKRAREAGIVVITHEASKVVNRDYDIEAFNNSSFGSFCLDLIAEQMNGEGYFTEMVGLLTNGSHNEWADAAVARAKEKYPKMTLLPNHPRVESKEDNEGSYQVTKELLKKYPELKGIQGASSADVPGICKAVEELGLSGKIVVGGLGIPSKVKQYVESGTLESFAMWDPAGAAYAMCSLAAKVLDGVKIENGMDLGIEGYSKIIVKDTLVEGSGMLKVTKENINEYDF